MKRFLIPIAFIVLLTLVLLAISASAQTVSPLITEFHGKVARGEFTVTNGGLSSLEVSVSARSFTVAPNGDTRFRPLDPTVHLKMDSFFAHLGVKQQRIFWYEVRCDQQPCALSIYVRFTGTKTREGVNLAVSLPHTIYFCEREKHCRDAVRKAWGVR